MCQDHNADEIFNPKGVCEIEDDGHLLQNPFCAVNSHEPQIVTIHYKGPIQS